MHRIFLPTAGLLLLAACAEEQTAETSPQLANPAALYCTNSGGEYEIRDGANGQTGICTLPDGREVDAWVYFRENHTG